jgi:hypothetical protein
MVVLLVAAIPLPSRAVTVYVVVVVGVAVGLDTVDELKPVAGLHEYKKGANPEPVAVNPTGASPLHMVPPPPEMLTVGLVPLMPVKAEVCPAVIVAPAAKRVLLPIAINFTQGLVD